MPISLLPNTAQAFAPRSAPTIVLSSKVEPWLTQTLKRVNKIKRPLNSIPQHYRCLTETLSGTAAIWTLCSIMLPKAPDSELRKDSNPLVEALFNYQLLHVDAYVVHVDMVSQHEVAFKLTPESIDALIEYHKDIYSVDVSANTWQWPEKEVQLKKLQEEFVQAVNKYVFRTGVRALEGLEEEGAGELLDGRSEDVKNGIMGLFLPLLPPPPRIVDVVRPVPQLLPSSPNDANWWHPAQPIPSHPAPVDSWRVLPSTPSPTIATCSDSAPSFWSTLGMDQVQLPSPTPSFSQPCYSTSSQYCSPPMTTAMPALPLPSMLAQCGTTAGMGFGGFAWSYNDFAPQYAATM
ncbi:hypothetical protein P152DRAFT_470471 [Eremomyces bilateralis CBS 781.70]|uniref:Uncharacterized protein n=1 Tax=Eremomyces bilateralis CBS 781.70 TaxID=1392243 RepID=A0A6G1GEZ9_9PEZI|nr:uncharacterized protein P152DRAFT_470471 [Eremomyces bilateralis CBS 781.70]KAF1816449.1 hypothetical protein P152DRAFT_470471 [Eremomyces bilateralis CBS 781.70]